VTPDSATDFLWGASTSAHQIEGNNTNTDWWAFEHSGSPLVEEPSGDAADSYHRWADDLDLLAGAGFTDYRFSIEWARIEPAPGEFSAAHLDHYRRMIDGARERGLRPFVTLHHFTNPLWFDQLGGWSGGEAVDRFVRYVETVAAILSDGVEHVCTVNEPHVVALLAALRGRSATRADVAGTRPDPRATEALVEAHHKAAATLRGAGGRLRVGWSVACLNAYAAAGAADDVAADFTRVRETIFVDAARSDDWIGVQAYTRTKVGTVDGRPSALPPDPDVERTINGWEYYPAAVGDAIRSVRAVVPDVPVVVTENGIATADDTQRIDYTTQALASMRAAMDDGADVRGYFHWSLLDNYEWGSYRPTFGLVAVDRATFARTPKPSLAWLGARRPTRSPHPDSPKEAT
jgi:beta-glucosidase